MSFLLKNSLKIPLAKQFFKVYCSQGQQLTLRSLKTIGVVFSPHKQNPDATQDSTKASKGKQTLRITLLQNENITVTGLEEAKNLAKRRSMHLVKVQDMDSKTQRPVYKLLTAAEMLQNELNEIKNADKTAAVGDKSSAGAVKKTEKTLSLNSRIAENDLSSRLKNITKWLNKQHVVRILIQTSSGQDMSSCEKIFKTIEEAVKSPQVNGKIVQKHTKGGTIKFSIVPVAPASNDNSASNSQ